MSSETFFPVCGGFAIPAAERPDWRYVPRSGAEASISPHLRDRIGGLSLGRDVRCPAGFTRAIGASAQRRCSRASAGDEARNREASGKSVAVACSRGNECQSTGARAGSRGALGHYSARSTHPGFCSSGARFRTARATAFWPRPIRIQSETRPARRRPLPAPSEENPTLRLLIALAPADRLRNGSSRLQLPRIIHRRKLHALRLHHRSIGARTPLDGSLLRQ